MTDDPTAFSRLGRRAFLRGGTLLLAAGSLSGEVLAAMTTPPSTRPMVRFGLITDLHFADKPPAGSRYYRETPDKLAEAAEHFRRDEPDFVIELGDLIDAADSVQEELRYLDRIDRVQPVYETLPGWRQATGAARRLADLPPQARAYLDRLQDLAHCPVRYVSVGTRRDQIIEVA